MKRLKYLINRIEVTREEYIIAEVLNDKRYNCEIEEVCECGFLVRKLTLCPNCLKWTNE